jgi:hypothetical protein
LATRTFSGIHKSLELLWHGTIYAHLKLHPLKVLIAGAKVFFGLDKTLDREDIEYMLHYLIQVPLIRKLPSRFPGESIVKGELSKFVTADDLSKVVKIYRFIQRGI